MERAFQTKLSSFKMFNWTLTPRRPCNLSLTLIWTFSPHMFTAQICICVSLVEPALDSMSLSLSLERSHGVLLFFLNSLRALGPRILGLGSKERTYPCHMSSLSFCSQICPASPPSPTPRRAYHQAWLL